MPEFQPGDPATKQREIAESIRGKIATKPRVDAQGKLLDPVQLYEYDQYGRLLGPVDATEPPAAS